MAFDVFVRKDLKKERPRLFKRLEKWKDDYNADDCRYVEKFLESNEGYDYLFSNDLNHIIEINIAIIELIAWILHTFDTKVIVGR